MQVGRWGNPVTAPDRTTPARTLPIVSARPNSAPANERSLLPCSAACSTVGDWATFPCSARSASPAVMVMATSVSSSRQWHRKSR